MRNERWALRLLTAVLVGWVWWTYAPALHHWPWGSDALKWLQRSDPARTGWTDWVFHSRHFIGWRPVTALSFAANGLWGVTPERVHGVDFATVGATIALIAAVGLEVFRSDRDDRSAYLAAGVAAALVALHPVLQEILPYVARRSYGLGSLFGLAGLWIWLIGLRRDGPRWVSPAVVVATALLALSCGSNEASFPIVAALPLFAWHRLAPTDGPTALRALRPAALPLAQAAWLAWGRSRVLADDFSTGYVKKYFAYASDGHNRLRQLDAFSPHEVVRAAWSYGLFPSSGTGDGALWTTLLGGVVAGAVVAWVCAAFWVWPARGWRDARARTPLIFALWGLGTSALYGLANTWFWREGYPLWIPLALALAAAWRDGLATPGRRGITAVAAGLVALSIGWWSPAVRGWDQSPLSEEIHGTRIVNDLVAGMAELPPYAHIWLIVPGDDDFADEVETWAQRLRTPSTLRFKVLGYAPRSSAGPDDAEIAWVRETADGPMLTLHPQGAWDDGARTSQHLSTLGPVPLQRLHPGGERRAWVWWWGGPGWDQRRTAPVPKAP
jgi:hypothetical protein